MATTIKELEDRLNSFEQSLIQLGINIVPVDYKADSTEIRMGIIEPKVDTNTEDIVDTQIGLAETYEETFTSITNVESALAEVYEMLIPPEENLEEE